MTMTTVKRWRLASSSRESRSNSGGIGIETGVHQADYCICGAGRKTRRAPERRAQAMRFVVLVAVLMLGSCAPHVVPTFGYRPEAVPGITKDRCLEVLGKPQESEAFSIPGTSVNAEVLTYAFGQVLVQDNTVVAVSVNNDPAFVGPAAVKIGMAEPDLRTALSHQGKHVGHVETYDAISGASDTRTKDIYDDTDHMMIELTATNANDPFAPFNIAQVTLANRAGMQLLDAFTKARTAGLYPDVHVDNFISNPWTMGH
jgi:hypothetical protein